MNFWNIFNSMFIIKRNERFHAKLSTLPDIFVEAYFETVEHFSIVSHLLSKKINDLNEMDNYNLIQ